jgi:hypothetical protein
MCVNSDELEAYSIVSMLATQRAIAIDYLAKVWYMYAHPAQGLRQHCTSL